MRHVITIFVFLLIIPVMVRTQSPTEPTLVDEFGKLGCCCELSARIDNLLIQLASSPNSEGYIVMSDPKNPAAAFRERYFDGYADARGFDETRIHIVRADFPENLQTQMWLVPKGMAFTNYPQATSKFEIKTSKRKSVFHRIDDGGELCSVVAPLRLLSKFLKAYLNVTANIAISARNKRGFEKTKGETIKRMKDRYDIDPSRLRFFQIRSDTDGYIQEIWLVRNKK